MNEKQIKALEKAGFKVGTVEEFLDSLTGAVPNPVKDKADYLREARDGGMYGYEPLPLGILPNGDNDETKKKAHTYSSRVT